MEMSRDKGRMHFWLLCVRRAGNTTSSASGLPEIWVDSCFLINLIVALCQACVCQLVLLPPSGSNNKCMSCLHRKLLTRCNCVIVEGCRKWCYLEEEDAELYMWLRRLSKSFMQAANKTLFVLVFIAALSTHKEGKRQISVTYCAPWRRDQWEY